MSEALRHAEIHHQNKVREIVGKQNRELKEMSLVLKECSRCIAQGQSRCCRRAIGAGHIRHK